MPRHWGWCIRKTYQTKPCPGGACILVGSWGETTGTINEGNVVRYVLIDAMKKNKAMKGDGEGAIVNKVAIEGSAEGEFK